MTPDPGLPGATPGPFVTSAPGGCVPAGVEWHHATCPGSSVLKVLFGLACAAAVALLTYPRWRPWCLTWGATEAEAAMALPGDELLEDPDVVTTRAVGIDVPPSTIWPWIVQMGPGRAGAYTYDWIENLAGLDMHSADEILPQFQDVRVGDGWQARHEGSAAGGRTAGTGVRSSSVPTTATGCGPSCSSPTGRAPGCSAATGSANREHRPRPGPSSRT